LIEQEITFVTGFPRSGTTWVNKIFWEYFDAAFVNEAQFILEFYKKLPSYGDLADSRNLQRLVADLLGHSFFRILKKAYRVPITAEVVIDRLREPSYAGIVYAIFEFIAEDLGRGLIGNKDPSLGWRLDVIDELFPRAKIVHVMRDGRDCALSHFGKSWGAQNIYVGASKWAKYMRAARAVGRTLGPKRYLEFRYEDLLQNPGEVFPRLEQFVLGDAERRVAQRFLEQQAQSAYRANFNKWQEQLTERQKQIFEAVAGDVLQDLGYPCQGYGGTVPVVSRMFYTAHDRVKRELSRLRRSIFGSVQE